MAEQNQDRLHIRLHVYDEEIEVVVKREEEEFATMPMHRHIRGARVIIQ